MDARLPDAFLKSVVDLLPAQAPSGPQGGRPPIDHATVLKMIGFLLTVACRWKDVPRELGCSGEPPYDAQTLGGSWFSGEPSARPGSCR